MVIRGANIITIQTRAVATVLIAGTILLYRTRKELPRKNAMKIERSTPVDLVKVAIANQMQACNTLEEGGIWKLLPL